MKAAPVQFHDHRCPGDSLREAVLEGLATQPKRIPPKFFYDQRGSELFEAICELPEYYLTRTETGILRRYAGDIAHYTKPGCLLVELGSGASKKVRLLLDSLRPAAYLGIDISRDFLLESTRRLVRDYPWLEVHAACLDFSQPYDLKWYPKEFSKLVFFPGSSIGNLEPQEAVMFLKRLRPLLEPEGALLIGVDLKKDPLILHAAYNDSQGVTAAFNLNLLRRIRCELNTDLVPERFEHAAFYNPDAGRIEMHLVSSEKQRIRVEASYSSFAPGETIHTENSYKYSIDEFHRLAIGAGYWPEKTWTDTKRWFSLHYLRLAEADYQSESPLVCW